MKFNKKYVFYIVIGIIIVILSAFYSNFNLIFYQNINSSYIPSNTYFNATLYKYINITNIKVNNYTWLQNNCSTYKITLIKYLNSTRFISSYEVIRDNNITEFIDIPVKSGEVVFELLCD